MSAADHQSAFSRLLERQAARGETAYWIDKMRYAFRHHHSEGFRRQGNLFAKMPRNLVAPGTSAIY